MERILSSPEAAAVVAEVERFAAREIAPRAARPEAPMPPAQLAEVLDAAEALGLFEGGEAALFREPRTAVHVLHALARVNAGAALAVGQAAAARRLADVLEVAVEGRGALAAHGRMGVGRGALARYLRGAPAGGDRALLADVYAPGAPRLLTAPEAVGWVLAPVVDDGGLVQWALDVGPRVAHPNAHGFDELVTASFTPGRARTALDREASRAALGEAIALTALSFVAVAAGAASRGHGLAAAFAEARRQGGALIAEHAAVQLLLASSRAALDLVEGQLDALAASDPLDVGRILALRAEAHPLLCRAANDALQVFGGLGYMRDTGAEKVLRDVVHLRAMAGAPPELALFVAAWDRAGHAPGGTPVANDEPPPERTRRALGGHVPATSLLSPRAAFERLRAVVRPLVRYEPLEAWEVDTRSLPGPLAAYRRRVRAFAEQHLAPRALTVDAAPHAPPGQLSDEQRAVLREAARAGFLSDLLPRPFGSADPVLLRYPLFLPQALKTEELAAVDGGLMLLVSASDLGVAPIVLSGELGAIRRFLLPAFRASQAGEPHVFAFAITEPDGGSDVEEGHGAGSYRPGVVARRAPGGYRIRGRKCYISGGDIARSVVVFAALEGEGIESWTAFLVRGDAPGLRVARTELKMGMRASGAAELELDDVFVRDDEVIGGLRNGWALNRATLNMSRVPVAAMGVGFARAATSIAADYAAGARLGGRPLIDYQDVQLALAQMEAETTAVRAMVWRAASRPQARQGEASAAKFHATDVARGVCERAMDLLGERAALHEARLEKVLRDVRLTQIFEGTNQINRLAVIEDDQARLLAAVEATRRP